MPIKKISTLHSKKRQSGLSLIESLVALVVLALGIMGLAGVQTRLLVETRTANSRAVAVQLIDDLTNRMALNRYEAVGQPQKTNPIFSSYMISPTAWSATTGLTTPNPATCLGAVCTAAQLAAVDMFAWRTAVNAALPGSQVRIFQNAAGDPRQLGIAIGWPLNEQQVKDGVAGSDATKYNAPFDVTAAANGISCPDNLICHLVYVQP